MIVSHHGQRTRTALLRRRVARLIRQTAKQRLTIVEADIRNFDSRRTIRNIDLLGVEHQNILQLSSVDETYVHALIAHSRFWKGEKFPHETIAEFHTHRFTASDPEWTCRASSSVVA